MPGQDGNRHLGDAAIRAQRRRARHGDPAPLAARISAASGRTNCSGCCATTGERLTERFASTRLSAAGQSTARRTSGAEWRPNRPAASSSPRHTRRQRAIRETRAVDRRNSQEAGRGRAAAADDEEIRVAPAARTEVRRRRGGSGSSALTRRHSLAVVDDPRQRLPAFLCCAHWLLPPLSFVASTLARDLAQPQNFRRLM